MAFTPLHIVEIKLISAKKLQNVKRRLRPYAVVWADPCSKCSTLAARAGGSSPHWNSTLLVLLPQGTPVEDAMLQVEIRHAGSEEGTGPLIGSAELSLRDVLKNGGGGGGGRANRQTLELKPQGTVDLELAVKKMPRRLLLGVAIGVLIGLVLAKGLDYGMDQIFIAFAEALRVFLSSDGGGSAEDSIRSLLQWVLGNLLWS